MALGGIDKHRLSAAKQLLEHPVVNEIFDALESAAINSAVSDVLMDDKTRAAYLAEVRVIRSLRRRLQIIVVDGEAGLTREAASGISALKS
jgi:hypothetical protein